MTYNAWTVLGFWVFQRCLSNVQLSISKIAQKSSSCQRNSARVRIEIQTFAFKTLKHLISKSWMHGKGLMEIAAETPKSQKFLTLRVIWTSYCTGPLTPTSTYKFSNWSPYIPWKLVKEFIKRSRIFFGDHFIYFPNLSMWLSIDVVRGKLMLDTLGS